VTRGCVWIQFNPTIDEIKDSFNINDRNLIKTYLAVLAATASVALTTYVGVGAR
jgi:hypothetical protein